MGPQLTSGFSIGPVEPPLEAGPSRSTSSSRSVQVAHRRQQLEMAARRRCLYARTDLDASYEGLCQLRELTWHVYTRNAWDTTREQRDRADMHGACAYPNTRQTESFRTCFWTFLGLGV